MYKDEAGGAEAGAADGDGGLGAADFTEQEVGEGIAAQVGPVEVRARWR